MKLKDEVGMAGPKSTQTRFVGIIMSTIHPYMLASLIIVHLLMVTHCFYTMSCGRNSPLGWGIIGFDWLIYSCNYSKRKRIFIVDVIIPTNLVCILFVHLIVLSPCIIMQARNVLTWVPYFL